jgi:hypothetical protein
MKKIVIAVFALLLSSTGYAQCVGTGAFKTCTDNQGNSYTVNKIGNTTYTQGRNSRTGSSWNQNSTTIGNATMHNGRAANGSSWNINTTNVGEYQYHSGRDSRGKPINCATGPYGLNTCD